MSRLPGINNALAGTIRRLNAHWARIPEDHRPNPNGPRWVALEAEIDRACAEGDQGRALIAIARYEGHAMAVLKRAADDALDIDKGGSRR